MQMVGLYRDPQGEKVFSKSAITSPYTNGDKGKLGSSDQTVESLQTKVKELEAALSKYENTQISAVEPMGKTTSKVSFSTDGDGQDLIETHLPSNGAAMKNKTAKGDGKYATSEL